MIAIGPHLRLRLRDGKRTRAHAGIREGKLRFPNAPDDDDSLRYVGNSVRIFQL